MKNKSKNRKNKRMNGFQRKQQKIFSAMSLEEQVNRGYRDPNTFEAIGDFRKELEIKEMVETCKYGNEGVFTVVDYNPSRKCVLFISNRIGGACATLDEHKINIPHIEDVIFKNIWNLTSEVDGFLLFEIFYGKGNLMRLAFRQDKFIEFNEMYNNIKIKKGVTK